MLFQIRNITNITWNIQAPVKVIIDNFTVQVNEQSLKFYNRYFVYLLKIAVYCSIAVSCLYFIVKMNVLSCYLS